MSNQFDIKLMDFIDDVILKFITQGTEETYASYREFMATKLQEFKNNPSKINDIKNIIPVLKLPEKEHEANQLQESYISMTNSYKVDELIEHSKKSNDNIKKLKEEFIKTCMESMSKYPSNKICYCGQCNLDKKNDTDIDTKYKINANDDNMKLPDLIDDSGNKVDDTYDSKIYSFTIPLTTTNDLSNIMPLMKLFMDMSSSTAELTNSINNSKQSSDQDNAIKEDNEKEKTDEDDKINISI